MLTTLWAIGYREKSAEHKTRLNRGHSAIRSCFRDNDVAIKIR